MTSLNSFDRERAARLLADWLRKVKLTQLAGESLTETHIPDDSFTLAGRGLPKEPDFVFGTDMLPHPIVRTTVPAETLPGSDLEALPERAKREKIVLDGVKCPRCGRAAPMRGWWLDAPETEANTLVQCGHCQLYIGVEVPALRKALEELAR
ncbi:MAG: hypothetical protein KJ888_20930 [Gammaproteobacteria bacterium]|nr:hypothetical protein [Gammaproteobacteria bacterium]